MFSFNSLKVFFSINTVLHSLAFIEYSLFSTSLIDNIFGTIIRNYSILKFINYKTEDKEDISVRIHPKERFKGEFVLYFLSTSILEGFTSYYVENNIINFRNTNYLYDIIDFIPLSLLFEIIFDFVHYSTHRLLHNPLLYTHIHKIHHKHNHPTSIIAFYQHPFDIFITNSIPFIISSLCLSNKMSYFQFKLLLIYKIFIEISGHTGKIINSCSFTQFIWVVKYFKIELTTENHDLHHTKNNCNYSKRFSLFDKLFGTFRK
jgi:sterol desaturase/sphingolipid hydroxylase (fatty acid hydroxylase superfamily)